MTPNDLRKRAHALAMVGGDPFYALGLSRTPTAAMDDTTRAEVERLEAEAEELEQLEQLREREVADAR
jgi:hypothetical protein